MLADPMWILDHWLLVLIVVLAIVVGKTAITCGVSHLFRSPLGHAAATGICLAQVGEFSFVLADVARDEKLIGDELFKLIVSVTIATLFLTPFFVAFAPRLVTLVGALSRQGPRLPEPTEESSAEEETDGGEPIVIVGFGPAGQRVAEALMERHQSRLKVLELNPRSAAVAESYGLPTYIGDATRREVLERLRIRGAKIVAVTVPDPVTSRQIIEQIRTLSPETTIIVRARYHVHRWQLALAGAQIVVDEEDWVGTRIASEVRKKLSVL
jgi:CPA2 family monovalent cation:H+ antiporter-2